MDSKHIQLVIWLNEMEWNENEIHGMPLRHQNTIGTSFSSHSPNDCIKYSWISCVRKAICHMDNLMCKVSLKFQ